MNLIVKQFPVLKGERQFDCMAFVEMHLGTKAFMVVPSSDGGMMIMGLCDPGKPLVAHNLLIMPAGVGYRMPLGMTPGDFLGYHRTDKHVGFVFKAEPWPTMELAVITGLATEGEA